MFASIWNVNLTLFHMVNGLGAYMTIAVSAAALNDNHILRFMILVSPYAYYWFGPNRTSDIERKLLLGFISVLLSIVIARALADLLPFETRPLYDPSSGFRPLAIKNYPDLEGWSSFPSDTAAVCFALTFSIFSINRWVSVALMMAALLFFCIPRVLLGIHYPADIAVGALIGVGSVLSLRKLPNPACVIAKKYEIIIPDKLFYPLMILYMSEASQMFNGVRSLKAIVRVFAR